VPTRERFAAGEAVGFHVIPSMSGYLYCYHQDATGTLRRIFPNRFTRDPRVKADRPLTLPGAVPMELRANAGANEAVGCFTTPNEIYNSVPAALRWGDFDPLRLKSFDEVAAIFGPITKGKLARAEMRIVTQ
jgi:hypothetical protein